MMVMMITTTMTMMVMDQFEDLGVGLGFVQAFKIDLKSYCICEHGSKLHPAQSTRWNIIATSCTMNFSFRQVLPILVMYPPPHPTPLFSFGKYSNFCTRFL
jgi:hypothetical protein